MRKSTTQLLAGLPLLALALVAPACSGAPPGEQAPELTTSPSQKSAEDAVTAQIEAAKAAFAANDLPIKILSYQSDAPLASDGDVAAVKSALSDDNAVVPRFDGQHPESFATNTVAERMILFGADTGDAADSGDSAGTVNVRSNLETMVYPLLKVGQKTLDITWERQDGTQFHSKCIYDDNGVVYDNILSNLVLVDTSAPAPVHGAVKPLTTAFTAKALDYTIKWIWGSTRGKIIVDHTIIWNGSNDIYTQNGSVDHWMTLGSTDAKTHGTKLDPHRYAVLAYGYAWATPTASFKISYDSSKAKFDVSLSGVGSKGGGDDHHTIYIP